MNYCQDLAPGLYFSGPTDLESRLETGNWVDFTDFCNACDTLHLHHVNASRTFNNIVFYLAKGSEDSVWQQIYGARYFRDQSNEYDRSFMLIGTQALADMVVRYEAGTFDDPYRRFTQRNWRVMRAVVRDELEIEFVREDCETTMKVEFIDRT